MAVTRSRLLLAGYGFFGVALFLAFVSASFPYTDSVSTLLAPMSVKVVFQQQAIHFPIGARMQNVQLISAADEKLLLQSPNVTVAPAMLWFFLGQLRLSVRMQIFGGIVDATIGRHAQSTIVEFKLKSLNLARMSREVVEATLRTQVQEDGTPPYMLGRISSGELSGRGSAQLTGPDMMRASASLMLSGRAVKAILVDGLPPLELGIVRGKVLLGQGIATLEDVRAQSAEGELAATGEIHFGPSIANSTVQLTFWLKPSAKGRAAFGMLLNMLPHSPSAGPYRLDGPLEFPTVR